MVEESQHTGGRMPWYDVWIDVVTAPSRETFRRILADPAASPFRAYIWLALLSLLAWVVQAVVVQISGIDNLGVDLAGIWLTFALCGAIAAPVGAVLGLVINTAILRFIAGLLGGRGSFDDLAYCLGSIQAPLIIFSVLISLISTVFTAMGGGGALMILIALVSFGLSLYALVLEVMAVEVSEKFGTGKAVLTALAPVIVAFVLAGCLVAFAIATLPAEIINQQFTP